MMWPLVPIFMSLMNIVTTRTEPMNFSNVGISDRIKRDQQKDIFSSQTDSMNAMYSDYARLKEYGGYHQKMNLNDDENGAQDWNEQETRPYEDPYNLKNTNARENDDDVDAFHNFDKAPDFINDMNEIDLEHLTNYLMKLVQQPSWQAPLIIIDETPSSEEFEETDLWPNMRKRSRGYRRYGLKRQHSRSFDYDTAYYCMPSRDDVFQLLVALHSVRKGNRFRHLHFCNRQRTAGTLFTNIRFLGRRK